MLSVVEIAVERIESWRVNIQVGALAGLPNVQRSKSRVSERGTCRRSEQDSKSLGAAGDPQKRDHSLD
eukprot:8438476-Pyramimonas_sp.AAC.1